MTIMDCRDFEDRLSAFEAGTLPPRERSDFEMHKGACARCRELHETVCGLLYAPAQILGEETIHSILRRTTGPACSRAEQSLCDRIDGDLEEEDRQILALHLEFCSKCSVLAALLAELKEVLPEMVGLQPDERFTEQVLQATSGRHLAVLDKRQTPRIADWWSRMIRRPRFAWEAAYTGALAMLLTLGNPVVISQIMPWALMVSHAVLQGSQEVIQSASLRIEERGEATQRSLYSLRQQGRQLWQAAADMQDQAATTFLEKASWWVYEFRRSWLDRNMSAPQKQNQH